MRRNYSTCADPLAERVKRLESELDSARLSILELMPGEVRHDLMGYYTTDSRKASTDWAVQVVQVIIERAELLPRPNEYFDERAMCPLCRGGSSSRYERGFSFPEGLRRHLVGYGNTRQCVVTKAAFELARDHWNRKFSAAEEEESKAHQIELERRRESETLYLTELHGTPLLLDENVPFYRAARDREELEWAVKRLGELDFSARFEGSVVSYVYELDDFLIFADPREKGEIVFRIFTKPLQGARRQRRSRALAQFSIPDRWKRDLREKYDVALRNALEQGHTSRA